MSDTKNLIMGLWTREPLRQLEPFIASLRHTGFAGDVCIFVEDVGAENVRQLRAHGIIVERAGASGQPRMAAMSSRYFSYLDFLIRCGSDYANVMLTDPASVVFQSDPFVAPLRTDIVYTQERRRLGESQVDHDAVVKTYGESVAHNIRDCAVSSPSATIGTLSGMLRYLAAMTYELSGRTTPITSGTDRGVHNYVVRMHPLRNAWLDATDSIAAAVNTSPDDAVRISEQGVLVDGRLVPVLSGWNENARMRDYVRSAPRFRPDGNPPPTAREKSPTRDAVIAFYQRQRDADWLKLFLGSLRCVTDTVDVHCVGDFDQHETAILSHYGCTMHPIPPNEPEIAENIAHFYLSQVLDRLTAERSVLPDQVLMLDCMRAAFLRDPFLTRTIGLSVFCEGAVRIAESDYNRDRLAFFVPPEESWLQQPVVSSTLLRGPLPVVREFYRQMFAELVGRADLLSIQKVVQGAVNKLCHLGKFSFPIIVHPNAAEAYFDFWPSDLAVDIRHGVRVGGSVPAVVLTDKPDTKLMRRLRIDLNLSDT